jgi:pilus assembly protein CpaB
MANRKVTLLAAAGAVALVTVLIAHNMMADKPAPEQQAVVQITEVAAAGRDLPTGTILKESDLKWVQWDSNADTAALLVKGKAQLSDAAGGVVRGEGFRNGQPIVAAQIAHPKDQGFLAAVLEPGKRAMSLSLSPTAEVAGFIFPGDRVDVILTHGYKHRAEDQAERRVSTTIIKNVRVLALDQRSDNQSTDPKVAQMATLEVDDRQAEQMALAINMATASGVSKAEISLVLRGLVSENRDEDTLNNAVQTGKNAAKKRISDDDSGEDSLLQRVQIMRGKTISEDTFERHR